MGPSKFIKRVKVELNVLGSASFVALTVKKSPEKSPFSVPKTVLLLIALTNKVVGATVTSPVVGLKGSNAKFVIVNPVVGIDETLTVTGISLSPGEIF